MSIPPTPTPPQGEPDISHISPARRRRQRRRLVPQGADERAAFLEGVAERAYPTAGFFLLCLLAGAIMGAGWLLDSLALIFVGVLLVPVLGPWVGMVLATVTGSWRFFFQTLAGLFIGGVLIFLTGLVAGFAARPFMPLTLNNALYSSRLWWPHLFVLVLGAILLPVSFVRSERRLLLPSAMLAFVFFLPLSASGLGLASGVPGLWPEGLIVFLIHFGLASLIGVVTLFIMGFRPYTLAGYTLGTALILMGLLALVLASGFGSAMTSQFGLPLSAATPTPRQPTPAPPTPTLTKVAPETATRTPTSLPPTATASATATLAESATATLVFPTLPSPTGTPLPEPTPVYAHILSPEGGGIALRDKPNGALVTTLLNGLLVEVISSVQRANNYNWVQVRAVTDTGTFEGWVIQDFLQLATPAPTWLPSATP
jgi:MFS family permease